MLSVWGPQLTDAGLKGVASLKSLQTLELAFRQTRLIAWSSDSCILTASSCTEAVPWN
jgi:hypothetical protein